MGDGNKNLMQVQSYWEQVLQHSHGTLAHCCYGMSCAMVHNQKFYLITLHKKNHQKLFSCQYINSILTVQCLCYHANSFCALITATYIKKGTPNNNNTSHQWNIQKIKMEVNIYCKLQRSLTVKVVQFSINMFSNNIDENALLETDMLYLASGRNYVLLDQKNTL